MNVVMTGEGKFVEVQGTAEGVAFDRAERTFFASGVYDTEPGTIRAFRMYYSPLL